MESPKRIVCLTEETCEWLYLLGEERRIVGISTYTVRPARAAREKPKVSAFISGNLPKIMRLKPDLVIGFSDIQADLAQKLIKEGLNVLITNQRSIEEIFSTLHMVARLVGRSERGQNYITSWQKKLDTVRRRVRGRRRPRVFFQEWDEPVISSIGWVSELIDICGGKNIFVRKSGSMAKERIVTLAEVGRKKPEIIIGSWCGKPVDFAWLNTQDALAETPALHKQRLYEIDSAEILQPGPALFIDGIDRIYEAIWREPIGD
jgi:iron complex transport system substrate-binding protein